MMMLAFEVTADSLPLVAAAAAIAAVIARFVVACVRASQRLARVLDTVERTERYTRHHLGPNGDSPAIHERLTRVEQAVVGRQGP